MVFCGCSGRADIFINITKNNITSDVGLEINNPNNNFYFRPSKLKANIKQIVLSRENKYVS